MIDNSYPLVSCICVTHNSVKLLNRSMECFFQQTYPNKELVLVYTNDNYETKEFLKDIRSSRIKTVEVQGNTLTLGEKRNLGIKESDGFYFCIWDDDDWYGVNRIAFHVQFLADTQYKSSALSQLFLYDALTKEAYLSAVRNAWEGTLLSEKSVTIKDNYRFQNLNRGEDSPFVFHLKNDGLLLTISKPSLYIYTCHGENTWDRNHWEKNIFKWATKLSIEQSSVIEKILNLDFSIQEASVLLEGIQL